MVIKCEAIKDFTLKRFDELINYKKKSQSLKGHIGKGDTFECSQELAEYLSGKNDKGLKVIRILEYIPNDNIEHFQE